jgi:hypothetical protein
VQIAKFHHQRSQSGSVCLCTDSVVVLMFVGMYPRDGLPTFTLRSFLSLIAVCHHLICGNFVGVIFADGEDSSALGLCGSASRCGLLDFGSLLYCSGLVFMNYRPNQSPEPTAVAAAVAIHAVSRRWFSFGR